MRVTFLVGNVLRIISDAYYEKAENLLSCRTECGNFDYGQSDPRVLYQTALCSRMLPYNWESSLTPPLSI